MIVTEDEREDSEGRRGGRQRRSSAKEHDDVAKGSHS